MRHGRLSWMHTEIAFSVPGMGVAPLLMTFPAPLLYFWFHNARLIGNRRVYWTFCYCVIRFAEGEPIILSVDLAREPPRASNHSPPIRPPPQLVLAQGLLKQLQMALRFSQQGRT